MPTQAPQIQPLADIVHCKYSLTYFTEAFECYLYF